MNILINIISILFLLKATSMFVYLFRHCTTFKEWETEAKIKVSLYILIGCLILLL